MKGIILAGGKGTRLYPSTIAISKQLLPVYDKPMIFYPLSILMLAGIKEILIISSPEHLPLYRKLFENSSSLGIDIEYAIQEKPRGIAEAFIIGEEFINGENVALVLGDNILYGNGLSGLFREAFVLRYGATIFAYTVSDPERYGVVEIDKNNKAITLEEKPYYPKTNLAVPGIYFYDNSVVNKAKSLKKSERNELEITDLNKLYLEEGSLNVSTFGRGIAWLDVGTHKALLQAANYVNSVQELQGIQIANLEEVAYRMGFIDDNGLQALINMSQNKKNKKYLEGLFI